MAAVDTLFPPEALIPPDAPDPDTVRKLPTPFRFIDLFAGIGGIRSGLESIGGKCVYTVEVDSFAMKTYSANFGKVGADGQRTEELARNIFDVKVEDIPAYSLLAAGFPCQPFSLAGVTKNASLGREHGFGHTSGNLFFQITRLIEEAETPPSVLFLENVKHLVRHDGGRTFTVIRETLKDLGYNISSTVVDASPWVPQKRERTFIIGLHRDVFGAQAFEFPRFPQDFPQKPWPVLSSILESGEVDARYVLSQHLWDYLQGYAEKHRKAGNGFGYSKFGPDNVARTLSARYHKDGSEILIETGKDQPRRLTPRECARLMGYPETFVIPVSDTQAYRQFGNSVVVPVIKFLAKELSRQAMRRDTTLGVS